MLSTLPDSVLGVVLGLLDGRSLARAARASPVLAAPIRDESEGGPALWRRLGDTYEFRQQGTRSRGRRPWAAVYADHVCAECIEPARVFVNDRVLPWPNGRFGLCSRCVRPATPLWRIARRREIRQDAGKLRHVLQRITVVRRELGYVCTATAARHRLRRAS